MVAVRSLTDPSLRPTAPAATTRAALITALSHPLGNADDVGPNVLTSSKSNIFTSFNLSPFSVLVQLFAYEEVIANGRLDACFDIDDGAGLTFYVPQLLTFLLHGAYLNSHDLETWLLGKCKLNVNFAHRFFWFLRSWCLGGGENHASENKFFSENSNGLGSEIEFEEVQISPRYGTMVESSLTENFERIDKGSGIMMRFTSFIGGFFAIGAIFLCVQKFKCRTSNVSSIEYASPDENTLSLGFDGVVGFTAGNATSLRTINEDESCKWSLSRPQKLIPDVLKEIGET